VLTLTIPVAEQTKPRKVEIISRQSPAQLLDTGTPSTN